MRIKARILDGFAARWRGPSRPAKARHAARGLSSLDAKRRAASPLSTRLASSGVSQPERRKAKRADARTPSAARVSGVSAPLALASREGYSVISPWKGR